MSLGNRAAAGCAVEQLRCRRVVGVVLATSHSTGGARMGTALRKPTVGGTSGIVAMIADALALVNFSAAVSLPGRTLLTTYEGL